MNQNNEFNVERPQKEQPKSVLKTLSDYKSTSIDWLWHNRIALGKLTIFGGDPDLGKSLATLDIAARVSCGLDFPDGSQCPEGDVVILTSEDDPGDTIKPRLSGLKADMNKIHILQGEWNAKSNSFVQCSLHNIALFYYVIRQLDEKERKLKLLIIDPLDSFLGGSNSNSNEEVRKALDGISNIAEKKKFAIIGIKHLNKGIGRALYRIGGSIAFIAKARALWVFVKDETGQSYFLPEKNNLSKYCGGFKYEIESEVVVLDDGKESKVPVIKWGDTSFETVDNIINMQSLHNKYNPTEQQEVLTFLQKYEVSKTTSEIAGALDKTTSATSKLLGKLKFKGLVDSQEHGKWVIKNNSTNTNV